jgi:hypothetical protein
MREVDTVCKGSVVRFVRSISSAKAVMKRGLSVLQRMAVLLNSGETGVGDAVPVA